eukprot:GILK01008553.1.p1 GENE.GILK01008553.1~~GILK01008553.1.p1  ORF type:complete len:787 (+),score=107.02 GILK01008553.1:89-2449(+)
MSSPSSAHSSQDMNQHGRASVLINSKYGLPVLQSGTSFYDSIRSAYPSENPVNNPIMREDDRIALAAQYVRDALEGRSILITPLEEHKSQRFSFIYASSIYKAFIKITIIAHLLLIFWEHPASASGENSTGVRLAEAAIICIYVFDILVRLLYMGAVRHFTKYWTRFSSFAIAVMLLDLLLSLDPRWEFRFSRPLRPLLFISKARGLRRSLSTIFKTMPNVFNVGACLFLIMLFFVAMGMPMLGGVYPDTMDSTSFSEALGSMLSLFILQTTENYPHVMKEAIDYYGLGIAVYFQSYLIITKWIFTAIILGAIFDGYKEQNKEQVLDARVREREALLAAYQVLQDDATEPLNFERFGQLMFKVGTKRCRDIQSLRVIFDRMDSNNDSSIELNEFLDLLDYLRFEVHKDMPRTCFCLSAESSIFKTLAKVDEWKPYQVFVLVVLYVNCLFLFLRSFGTSDAMTVVLDTIWFFSLATFIIHLIIKLVLYGGRQYFKDLGNVVDAIIVGSLVVNEWMGLGLYVNYGDRYLWVVRTVRSICMIRLLTCTNRFRTVFIALLDCLGPACRMGIIMLCAFYVWGVIGMEVFHGFYDESMANRNFQSVVHTYMFMFQISVGNNWDDLVYALRSQENPHFAAIFCVSFYITIEFVLLNLLSALLIEAFALAKHETRYNRLTVTVAGAHGPERWHLSKRERWSKQFYKDQAEQWRSVEVERLERRLNKIGQHLSRQQSMRSPLLYGEDSSSGVPSPSITPSSSPPTNSLLGRHNSLHAQVSGPLPIVDEDSEHHDF